MKKVTLGNVRYMKTVQLQYVIYAVQKSLAMFKVTMKRFIYQTVMILVIVSKLYQQLLAMKLKQFPKKVIMKQKQLS